MIAQSQSGTGKTAAFVLTMLSRVDTSQSYPQVSTCVALGGFYNVLFVYIPTILICIKYVYTITTISLRQCQYYS